MSASITTPKPTLRAYVSPERHRDVRLAASIAGVSVSRLIDNALRAYLGAWGQEGVRRYEG
jgi:predicted HicB family RNase H-like nuclease